MQIAMAFADLAAGLALAHQRREPCVLGLGPGAQAGQALLQVRVRDQLRQVPEIVDGRRQDVCR